jgi:GNAT superfamily N-acetyltransferase
MRPGGPDDIAAVLALGDDAVAWMNARGNTQQWGTAPWTGRRARETVVRDQAHGGGMRIAEDQDGTVSGTTVPGTTVPGTTVPGTTVLGALVITEIPAAYVPAAAERELYVNLLLVSRRHRGQGVGAALIGHAKQEAAARGIGLIRVDCWAGEDGSLVRVYERYGFSRVQEFTVALPAGAWPGMLLAMRLADEEVAPGSSV